MKRIIFFVAVILGMIATQVSLAQDTPSDDKLSVSFKGKSKVTIKKYLRKTMNEGIETHALKWISNFTLKDRSELLDEIEADLLTLAKEFHKHYLLATNEFYRKQLLRKKRKSFPLDPSKEVKEDYYIIGQYLCAQLEGIREYLANGNHDINDYFNLYYYESSSGQKEDAGKFVARAYANELINIRVDGF